jgi:putative ABC transport system permease protein
MDFPDAATDVWIPIAWAMADAPAMAQMRVYRAFSTVARLAPDEPLDRLQSELDLLGTRVTADEQAASARGPAGKTVLGERFSATRLRDQIAGDARQPLLILFGAVALVLLIACVNAANLLLARASSREKEFAVRRAIGAGRATIAQQLLVESLLLALAAAGVGLALAAGGLRLLAAQLPQGYGAGIDTTVLVFTVLLAMITGVGFGLAPALRASSAALEPSLRDHPGGTAGRTRRRARDVLIVTEVAVALVLLVGSALLVASFLRVSTINPGFDPQDLVAARIRLTPERYTTASQQRAFFDDVVLRLRHQPDVGAITYVDQVPLSGMQHQVGMDPQRIRSDDPDQFLTIAAVSVGDDFFSTMRVPIVQGRGLGAADNRDGAPPVCVVSRSLADRLWPHQNPIGQAGMGRQGDAAVVGVAADVRGVSLRLAGGMAVYTPAAQDDRSYEQMWIVARSRHPLRVAASLREIIHDEDAAQPIAEIATYDQMMQRQYANLTLVAALVTMFAGLALVLAVIGIAGVTAYAVSQRTRELGIRIALGARTIDMLRLVLGETAGLVAIGLVVGVAAALALTRTLQSLLYGVTSSDPATFTGAALALAAAALVATYVPARRVGHVNPVDALRGE